jgi:hypothetical protein
MNHDKTLKTLVAFVGGISTTIGQFILLFILFPTLASVYGLWIVVGLLCFNCGAALLAVYFF